MFLKLLVLLYVDDTIILSDGIVKIQHSLKVFKEYCQIWKLQVNLSKTKIVIFSRDKIKNNCQFLLYNKTIEIVDEYKYLGVFMGGSGSSKTYR